MANRTQVEAMEEWEMLKSEFYDQFSNGVESGARFELEYQIACVFSELEHLSGITGKEAMEAFRYPAELR